VATLKDIENIMKNKKSPFLYYPLIIDSKTYVKIQKKISKDEIVADYFLGKITLSDLFITFAIAKNTFANYNMIQRTLRYISKVYPEKPVPMDTDYLKTRLDMLAKAGLLWKYSYIPEGTDKKQVFFCVTANGYGFLVRILEYKHMYDNMGGITPIDSIVKHLSASDIISRMLELKGVEKFNTYEKLYSKKDRKAYQLYGKIIINNNGTKYCTIIEPLFFRYDKARINGDENEKNIRGRITVIETFINTCLASGIIPFVIVVCEGYNELVDTIKLIKNEKVKDEYISYTTTSVINEFGIKEGLLSTKIKDDDGKKRLSLTKQPAQPIF